MTDHIFSLTIPLARLPRQAATFTLSANAEQRAELARRFGLESLGRLDAELAAHRTSDGAEAHGRMWAEAVQRCVLSGAPVHARIDQPLSLQFAPAPVESGEIELDPDAADHILIEGDSIDLAEAVAQSLLLALDPWPRADDQTLATARAHVLSEEEDAARKAGERASTSPFAALRKPD